MIAYHDNSDAQLMLAREKVKEPSSPADWDIASLTGCGPLDISMVLMADGKPAISFVDTGSSTFLFRFARAKNSNPSLQADWTTSTIDSHASINVGQYTSLQVHAGVPVVGYNSSGDLKYAAAKLFFHFTASLYCCQPL